MRLRAALERRGYTRLTTVQDAVLDLRGEPRDLQISSQTGSGKTVALGFVTAATLLADVPAEVCGPAVLVIVPTRELAAQVRAELAWLYADVPSVTLECVTGGTSIGYERGQLRRKPRVLVGTPGRLLDHLTSGALSLAGVSHLVLDEADQMLDMGFREDLDAILAKTPAERRTHLVSATFPAGILRLAERYQENPLHVQGTRLGEANGDIEHLAYRVHDQDRYAALVNLLLAGGDDRTLVFVNRRSEATELAEKLGRDGFSALPLSGELVQAQRTRTLAAFKSGKVSVLVATDVASRGLDVPDVATVIHATPGYDGEVYTHRSGRTGRAGRKGRSLLLVPVRKERRVRALLASARVDVRWLPVPTAAEVKKLIDKITRRATWEALASAPDPSPERIAQAGRLLEGRDAAQVLATFLEWNHSQKGPQPLDFTPAGAAPERRDERKRGKAASPRASGATTRFRINWGFAAGANPQRILAHICRRGGIQGRDVGAIRLQSHASTFEVQRHVAAKFEARVRVSDSRDPHLRIQRTAQDRRPAQPTDLARV